MSRKYILNKTNSVLSLHNNKLVELVTLQPKQCSFQSFDEMELMSSQSIYRTYQNGYIDFVDERVQIVTKNTAKNYGQKYKIGTTGYLNDKNNLDIKVLSYNPNNSLYTVEIVRTGGKIVVPEDSITLKKNIGDQINADIDENGDLVESEVTSTPRDLSLPQEPSQVQIIRTKDQSVNRAVSAKQIIDNQNNLAEEIANQKVEIVYKDKNNEPQVNDEETFIVKAKDGKFAKEITSSEMIENTQKVINEKFQEVIDSTVVAKPEEKEANFDTDAYVALPAAMKDYINSFMGKDARNKKMIIARLKDVSKLQVIANFADELSKKAALAKLAKLG